MDNDVYLFDTERLHGIASEEMVKQGLRYFSDNRVIGVMLEHGQVQAQVEDENEEQYWLELSLDDNGTLQVVCDCHAESGVCVHAIAALYAYADQFAPIDTIGLGSALVERQSGFWHLAGHLVSIGDALAAFLSSANPLTESAG
jgi:uncharacterized Zn finger protein